MKINKHPHHDLIVEWAKDTSKAVQLKIDGCWCDARMPNWDTDREYRIKPREFTKGHWYPCLDCDYVSVKMWTGSIFINESHATLGFNLDDFTEVGESLGEIKLGGEL